MKTVRTRRENKRTELHDFGITDAKGRAVGAGIQYSEDTFEAATDEVRGGYYRLEPGTYFAWEGQATRGGHWFGAVQPTHYCKTEAERDEQVAKYLKSARARATKAHS